MGFQEFPKLCRRLELRDGIQFLERGGERIRSATMATSHVTWPLNQRQFPHLRTATGRNWDVIQEQSKPARPCSATKFRGEPVNCGGHWFPATSTNRVGEALYMATTTDGTQLRPCVNLFL